jgi:hypothetical protein
MRNWIIGAAAALAVVAAPSVAAAQATGYAGLVYNSSDFGGAGDDVESWGAEGAVAFAGSGSIVFEVDAAITTTDDDGAGDDDTGYGIVGHIYSRNSDHLLGGFVGIAGADDSETWLAGLEASKFFEQWTAAVALFYGNNDDAETDGFGANVEGRVFLNDNLRLNGNIGWVQVEDAVDEDDAMFYGVGGEFQFASMPISVGAGWSTFDFDGGEIDTWTIAARWNFGGLTLRDRDRNGASQASVVGLANAF